MPRSQSSASARSCRSSRANRVTGRGIRRHADCVREIDRYLTGQGAWLVNYAERHRAGLGTSITEGTANFLVNRRMNKSQQMRWSWRGADLLLQCAGFNGKLGSSFGQLFDTEADPLTDLVLAA